MSRRDDENWEWWQREMLETGHIIWKLLEGKGGVKRFCRPQYRTLEDGEISSLLQWKLLQLNRSTTSENSKRSLHTNRRKWESIKRTHQASNLFKFTRMLLRAHQCNMQHPQLFNVTTWWRLSLAQWISLCWEDDTHSVYKLCAFCGKTKGC